MVFLIVGLTITILAGVLAHHLAVRKNRNPPFWVIASVLFVVPVLVLALLPPRRQSPSGPTHGRPDQE